MGIGCRVCVRFLLPRFNQDPFWGFQVDRKAQFSGKKPDAETGRSGGGDPQVPFSWCDFLVFCGGKIL